MSETLPPPPDSGGAPVAPKELTFKERLERNLVVFFLGTLLTGFLAGIGVAQWLGRGPFPCPGDESHRLIVTRVEHTGGGAPPDGYRLTLRVNDQPYSFPVNGLWGKFGGSPDPVSFILPQSNQFRIQISALMNRQDGLEPVATSQIKTVEAPKTSDPAEMEYSVGPLRVKFNVVKE